MDMRLDPSRIRTERSRRAWSQQHLATVSGLSLRTVQRAEQSGLASFETASAIAACLEVPVTTLAGADAPPVNTSPGMIRKSTAWLGMATAFLAGMIVTVTQPIIADEAIIDISVRKHGAGDDYTAGEVILESPGAGLETDVPITAKVSDSISLTLLPLLMNDGVLLRVSIVDERKGQDSVLPGAILVLKDGDEGRVFIPEDSLGSRAMTWGRSWNEPGYSIRLLAKIPPPSSESGASR